VIATCGSNVANTLVVLCWPKITAAQTVIQPKQTEIQRRCSEQADALGIHGEVRKVF
jgi:hypothetical protein